MKTSFLPALVWLAVITVLSTMPGVQLPKFNLISADKLAHAGVYAVLVWLMLHGFARAAGRAQARRGEIVGSVVFAAAYGALMEWVQGTFFPGRFFEWDDMLANTLGALAAWAAYPFFYRQNPAA